jgi:hypothetical protein
MIGVSSAASVFATPFPTVESIQDDMIEPSSYDPYDMAGRLQVGGSLETTAGRWTMPPAKMRITRKASADPAAGAKKPRRRALQGYEADMMGTSGQPNLGVIRVCSDCNTTKTPLWRSGPCGPKVGTTAVGFLFASSNSWTRGPCTLYDYLQAHDCTLFCMGRSRSATHVVSGSGRRGRR